MSKAKPKVRANAGPKTAAPAKTEAEPTAPETAVEPRPAPPELGVVERVLATGDLSKLTPEQRAAHLMNVCQSLGLNHLTRPFEYIQDPKTGKMTLYARRDCTDQLRQIHGVAVLDMKHEFQTGLGQKGNMGMVVVTVKVRDRYGRTDTDIGAVPYNPQMMGPDELSNTLMKAVTKAKRRATLSLCGLGMTDESELGTMANYQIVVEEAADASPKALPALAVEDTSFNYGANAEPAEEAEDDLTDGPSDTKPSDAAFRLYEALVGKCETTGMSRENVKSVLKTEFGVDSSRELSADQLSNVIDRLKAYLIKKGVQP